MDKQARQDPLTGGSANDCVVGAATHALGFQNWYIQNDSQWIRDNNLGSAENFREVIERVDHFFAALRAVSGVQTGYCQLLIRPGGWCDSGRASLPQVDIIPLRTYPDHFEHYGWLRTPPVLDAAACAEAGKLYTALVTLNKNELLVASRRLNQALLRSSEQDSILDVAIGLETLLVEDGAKGEINHKLAMRLGALCKMRPFEDYQASEVFGLCKKLYEFRSAVAHGSRDMSKKRVIKVRDTKDPIEAVVIGTSLLRYVIRFLAEKPEFLVARNLDMTLLGGGSPSPGQAEDRSSEEEPGFPTRG
jgi:Apea-like HEPN